MLSWNSATQIQIAKPASQHHHELVSILTLKLHGPQYFYEKNLG